MSAWYNEIDKHAAAWLRELIRKGYIAHGDVDERDIRDVRPADLAGYTQCHFFAGIGVWSYALRQAGWPDDRLVWTGSCPCQSFSAAGRGGGFNDERHLWPAWHHLISECRPPVIFGEQVEAAIRYSWLDLVQTDLESIDYAFAAFGLPAAGFGAPHIRARLWFVADSERAAGAGERGESGGLAPPACEQFDRSRDSGARGGSEHTDRRILGHAHDAGSQGRRVLSAVGGGDGADQLTARATGSSGSVGNTEERRFEVRGRSSRESGRLAQPVAVNSFWSDAEWLPCRDGKARPVEPGLEPLVTGAPARVGRLRGYGNAINAEVATEFIQAYLMRS